MASNTVNVGHAPFFDGQDFDYWKTCMLIHLEAVGETVLNIVEEGYVVLDPAHPTPADKENIKANAQAKNILIRSLCKEEYHRVCKLKTAYEMWKTLLEAHEGTKMVKSAKLFICKGKFEGFTLLPNEELKAAFARLNNMVNDLKDLGHEVPDVDISHKFLRALPSKYETIVTMLVRSNLEETTPSEILGEVLTHDIFKQSQVASRDDQVDMKKKSVAFKASVSHDDDDEESGSDDDEDVALMVRKFKKFMKKGTYRGFNKNGKSSKKNPFANKKCYECGEFGHISTNCKKKNHSDDDDDEPRKNKKFVKRKFLKKSSKKKNGKAYYVEWDSDASSDTDSDDEDDKPSKKGLAGIAIKEAPSLFDSHYCFMAKGESKVCNDDYEPSYDELVEMLSELDDVLGGIKSKYKDLKRKHSSLQEAYDELKSSHEDLKETHEKLEETHKIYVAQHTNKVQIDAGVSCNLIDDMPIAHVTSSSISTSCDDLLTIPCPSKIDTCMNNVNACDPLLIVENHELRDTVDHLVDALAKCHKGENVFNEMWKCQRFTLKHEGLGYIPKKNKNAFVAKKSTFVKESGLYCSMCKNTGHLAKDCIGKRIANVAMDASYMLVKSSNGVVHAKFVGKNNVHTRTNMNGTFGNGMKKRSIWVPKVLVTNLQGPKQIWVPKNN